MINRLISLELQGYKTFASNTSFEFPGQVTAIVGPNGSGKSNIADAVRWVLGEQAYSLLRGKRTEDMIFSGSQQRARASMASVAIKFNNEDGWLPVDFSEVVITRRAYRSGENEYLLNNQRVRLKEINELLGNSGLGERNYTIIGQGLIDNALSLKPDERRKFIEEAAGIDLYRSRREDSIQKLDKTVRNMERVNDILGELKPRLNTLSRSKEKTSQYKQIQNDLKFMLKDWYGYHWNKSQKEINEARLFFKQQKSVFETAKNDIDTKENQLNQIQGNLQQNRSELADLHKKVSSYHLEIEEITRNTAVLEEREKTLKLRISELENEIETNRGQKENHLEDLGHLESHAARIKSDLISATQNFQAAEEVIIKKLAEKLSAEEEIERIQKLVVAGQSTLIELNSKKKSSEKEVEQKKLDILESEKFLERTKKELAEIDSRKKEGEAFLQNIRREFAEKTSSINTLEESIKSVSEKIHQLNEEKQNKNAKLSTLAAEFRVLKDAEEHLDGFTSGSATILEAAKERKIQSGISSILQHLDISEKYEVAIAAGLGELLEGVVLEERESTREILQFLESNQIARTSMFTGRNDKQKNEEMPQFDGSVVYADSILNGSSRTTQMIRELLSRTVIVEDRQQALRWFDEIKPGWKLVTMIGEVFDASGIVTAGTGNRVQPIRRKREKKHLDNEIQLIQTNIGRIDTELVGLRNNQSEYQNQLSLLRIELKKDQETILTRTLEHQKLELERSQKDRIIQEERIRKQNLEHLVISINEQILTIANEITKKDSDNQLLQPNVSETTISSINNEVETLRKELLDLSSRKAVAEELDSRQNDSIGILKNSLDRINQKILELENRLESQKRTLAETIEERTLLSINYSGITEKIEKINLDISPLENIVESIIGQQGKIIEEVDESRKQFAIIERHTMQSQLRIEKLQDKLEMLKQKIEEDFGLVGDYEGSGYYAEQPLPIEEILVNLPTVETLDDRFEPEINQKKSLLKRLGPVNPEAEKEYEEVNERFSFLSTQLQDLQEAENDLREVVKELDGLMENKFIKTFSKVNDEFEEIFGHLFNGGSAKLIIGDEQNVLDGGIDIEATLPGKRRQELALLSGGERSLTAVALIFALLKISPTPFCILDEVDAMLDETNVVKFGELLRELSDSTQFIVITHNRNTVQLADILYGVTMGKDTVSQVISLKMDELTEEMVQ